MATAEKAITLTIPNQFPVHSHSSATAQPNGFSQSLANIASRVFGCWHRDMSRPFTRQGQTFRTCLDCGARRQFDLGTWETRGGFYRTR